MTLFKQIAIILSVFIVLVLSSIMYLNFKTANDFIQNQLYTTSEDTATSLGLSLSLQIPEDKEDLSTMDTMINAIFDRGYYENITLKDNDSNILIEKKNILKVKTVPNWFISTVKLEVPEAQTQISAGWIPFGTLHVKLHSGHAYLQLWESFIEILQSFVLLTCSTLLILYFLLKLVLQSLKGVEEQAVAITNNKFIIQENIPFTTEFRTVLSAMNKMVIKVKEIFEHEALMVKKYNDLLYNDNESGLGNRKFFSLKLSSLLSARDLTSSGTIVIFSIQHFSETKKNVGYKIIQDFVQNFSNILYNATKGVEERAIARIKDHEFAIILPGCDYEKSKEIIEHILAFTQESIDAQIKEIKEFKISGGATYYDEDDTQKEILARCDFALATAMMKEESIIVFHDIQNTNPLVQLGQQEWHKLISNAIEKDGIHLALQPVLDSFESTYHYESYLRLSDEDNNTYSAGLFMPMLNTLNLTQVVDKRVFELAFQLASEKKDIVIAINVANSFIKGSANLYWLESLLKKYTKKVKVSFESSNYAITHNLEEYISFSNLVKSYGFYFGIDNFSIGKRDLNYLQEIQPNYIKADKSFYLNMQNEKENNSYQSFRILVNSLEIKLIATAVETKEEYDTLKAIPIDYLQGSYIAKPSM